MASPELFVVDSSQEAAVRDALIQLIRSKPQSVFLHDPARPGRLNGVLPDQPVLVIETSGSTGSPKQVWLTPDALRYSAQLTSKALGEPGGWWLALPTHYIAGVQVVLRALITHMPLVESTPGGSVWEKLRDDCETLQAIKDRGLPVYTSLVPTQLSDLLDAVDEGHLSAEQGGVFDSVLVGGQRVDADLIDRAQAVGIRVIRTYGAAETAGGCVWDGKPLDGVSVDLFDGHVALSGPILAGGYVGDESGNEAFFVRDGKRWFVTSDRGELVDGALSIVGRSDDVFISGGLKVSAAEIERVLRESGTVPDAVVLAVPHPRWGSTPVVFTTYECDLAVIRSITKGALGPAAQPEKVARVDEWPLLSSGKLDRRALMESASTELT
jgi:O-succinylbenzoic acid--CoA ligase